jgi:hypothetical protein
MPFVLGMHRSNLGTPGSSKHVQGEQVHFVPRARNEEKRL